MHPWPDLMVNPTSTCITIFSSFPIVANKLGAPYILLRFRFHTIVTMRAHFKQYGSVLSSCIMVNPKTLKPRGFGFVTVDSEAMAEHLLTQQHTIDGKEVCIILLCVLWKKETNDGTGHTLHFCAASAKCSIRKLAFWFYGWLLIISDRFAQQIDNEQRLLVLF